eukprot:180912_1
MAVPVDTMQNEGEKCENDIPNHFDYNDCKTDLNSLPSKIYDTAHENKLIDLLIHKAMYFHSDTLQNDKLWEKGDSNAKLGIMSYHKIGVESYCYLRAAMNFTKSLKLHNIFDYYAYLECGKEDKSFLWDATTKTNVIKIFDSSHQLVYSKNEVEAHPILKLFGGYNARDMYYISTRFKRINVQYRNYSFDIVGSLNYSVSNDEMFPIQLVTDKNCVQAIIKYTGSLLVENKDYNNNKHIISWKTKLVHASCFNPNVNLPKFIKKTFLKSKAVEVVKTFHNSWLSKMECLEKRKMNLRKMKTNVSTTMQDIEHLSLKMWLNNIGLTQYYNLLVQNGFENISYLTSGLQEKDLIEIGIHLKGHRLKLLSEIKKLQQNTLNE